MDEKKVIAADNLPTKYPVTTTLACLLAIEVWSLPGWAKGVIWTLLGLIWIGSVINIIREKRINIFEDKK